MAQPPAAPNAPASPLAPPSNVSTLPTASRPHGELNALLGKGSTFEGKLLFEGAVRIDGKFSGEIVSTDTLIVGEGAEVKANVQVGTLTCLGDFTGDVRAVKSIELKAPAKVHGNLTTASILIERGVYFEGHCKMDPSGTGSSAPPKKT